MGIMDFIKRFIGINSTNSKDANKPLNKNIEEPSVSAEDKWKALAPNSDENDHLESEHRPSTSLYDDYSKSDGSSYFSDNCGICGKNKGGFYMYRCSYCGMKVCDDHRLPEKHNCPNISALSPEARIGTTSVAYKK